MMAIDSPFGFVITPPMDGDADAAPTGAAGVLISPGEGSKSAETTGRGISGNAIFPLPWITGSPKPDALASVCNTEISINGLAPNALEFGFFTGSSGEIGKESGFTLMPSLIKDLDASYSTFGMSPSVGYFVKDNLSVGLRFKYAGTKLNIGNAALSLGDDLSFGIEDKGYRRQSYQGTIFTRYYVPFMGSKIFGWFVEGGLNYKYAQGINYTLEEDLKHGVYNDTYMTSLTIDPGICFFVANQVSFEAQVGLAELGMTSVKQSENQVKTSEASRLKFSGGIDILDLKIGARFFF